MSSSLIADLMDILDELSGGVHPGFRPAHAKGLMCTGSFTPSSEAARLTRAPHANRPSTPVIVRYSNGTGMPAIPDNDPAQSGPRGIAVRFQLADHEESLIAIFYWRRLDELDRRRPTKLARLCHIRLKTVSKCPELAPPPTLVLSFEQ